MKLKIPIKKPVNRTPIPPIRKERDRKNDFNRNEKHRKQSENSI